jgi:hypothetical protein
VRLIRALALVIAGVFAGFAAAGLLLWRALPSHGDAESDEVALTAIHNGLELTSRATAFRGGSMFTWFGGIAVDLRDATLAPGARLSLTTVFGGIDLRVPHGWRVESRIRAGPGGVAVDVPDADDPAPLLVLDGVVVFGGVAVGAAAATVENGGKAG